jgi:hypothetical protein
MNKFFLCTLFIVLCYLNLNAQKVYKFSLSPVQTRVSNSLYNSLAVLDYRVDTTSMGVIQPGMLARYAKVVPAIPISSQYKTLFNAVVDSTAANGQLLLQIRRLFFAQRERQLTYEGYFTISYALTLSALSLRALKWLLVFLFAPAPMDVYHIVSWLGWTGNLLVAEIIIRAHGDKL